MRVLILLLLYIVLSIICGALLSYPLMVILEPLLELGYRKYPHYSTLLCGVIFSILYVKCLRLPVKQSLGYDQPVRPFIKHIIQGCLAGMAMMAIVAITLQITGIHVVDSSRAINPGAVLEKLSGIILAALAIGFIEESIFRGALLAGLHRQLNAVVAILLSALLYAAVHFIYYPIPPEGMEIRPLTAFMAIPQALHRFSNPVIIDHFMTLTMFGVLLGLIRLRSSSLATCIGVHVGVVIVIKLVRYYTNSVHSHDYLLLNRYNDMVGWFTCMVLLLTALLYAWLSRSGRMTN